MNKWTLHQKKLLILAYTSLLLAFSFCGSDYGVQLTLTWEKPVDIRVTGYNIYFGIYGTEFNSTPVRKINSADQTTTLISGIEEGKTYNFAATSIDAKGNESAFSEIITYAVLPSNDIDDDQDGYTENQGDCNDNEASIHPGAIEICNDGIDQDCNGSELTCIITPEDVDDDGDEYTEDQGDSSDTDASIGPAVIVICGNNISQEGSGLDAECRAKKKNGDNGCFIESLCNCFNSDVCIFCAKHKKTVFFRPY